MESALDHYRTAVDLDPESAMAAYACGRLLLAKGELESSLALLVRASELDPDAGAIRGSLARVYPPYG